MNKLSKSDAGKLGALKSKDICKQNYELRVIEYLKSPKKCKYCDKILSYNDIILKKKFCNRSCSVSYNNSMRSIKLNCKHCGKQLSIGKNKQFCSNKCHKEFQYSKYIKDWLSGKLVGYKGKQFAICGYVRRFLLEQNNYSCSLCGWDKRHPVDNKPLVEIDHIDGDASNCTIKNLRVLCPNCHSMTHTFKNRNKNSKRNLKNQSYNTPID